jgi:hypothetical protein
MRYLGDAYDLAKTKAAPFPAGEDWEAKKTVAVSTPRLISISGFQNLFEQYGRRSSIQHQLDTHSEKITCILVENTK